MFQARAGSCLVPAGPRPRTEATALASLRSIPQRLGSTPNHNSSLISRCSSRVLSRAPPVCKRAPACCQLAAAVKICTGPSFLKDCGNALTLWDASNRPRVSIRGTSRLLYSNLLQFCVRGRSLVLSMALSPTPLV